MASNAQITANQINSQSSTGPRTEEGKQTSARNNFRHGLASHQILIPGENRAEFEGMRDGFMADQKPTNMMEAALVNNMVTHYGSPSALSVSRLPHSRMVLSTKRSSPSTSVTRPHMTVPFTNV
jgi:hypothetical protein